MSLSPPPRCFRHQIHHNHHHHDEPLLPGLPDHLAQICLARVPPSLLYSVCHSWRRLLYSPSFPPFLSLYALLSDTNTTTNNNDDNTNDEEIDGNNLILYFYDPLSATWQPLPSPPTPHPILRHPSFLFRPLPLQTLSTPSLLLLVAASSPRLLPALPAPVTFRPLTSSWSSSSLPAFPTPRRWCVAASALHRIFLFSGVGTEYSPDIARSAESLDSSSPRPSWSRLAPLRDSRFCREPVDAVAARGRVYVVNARGKGARDGAAYDVEGDRWGEMPRGMLEGWTGPAVEESGNIYMAGEEGVVREYGWGEDTWREVAKAGELRGAARAAAGGGRVCVVAGEGERVCVVDVREGKGKGTVWVVEAPRGRRIVAVHVLPRPGCAGGSRPSVAQRQMGPFPEVVPSCRARRVFR